MVVICSKGNSPRHSLQDTSGSRAKSQVGRYLAVVMMPAAELKHRIAAIRESLHTLIHLYKQKKLLTAVI